MMATHALNAAALEVGWQAHSSTGNLKNRAMFRAINAFHDESAWTSSSAAESPASSTLNVTCYYRRGGLTPRPISY